MIDKMQKSYQYRVAQLVIHDRNSLCFGGSIVYLDTPADDGKKPW